MKILSAIGQRIRWYGRNGSDDDRHDLAASHPADKSA
jgi:hypothetical protein